MPLWLLLAPRRTLVNWLFLTLALPALQLPLPHLRTSKTRDQYFGHLYGQTIGVDVENAAVRELRNDEASGLEFNFEQGEGLDFSRRKGEKKAEPTGLSRVSTRATPLAPPLWW